MMRRGLTERSPSVCAFCQHRLSLRRTRLLPARRLLSSTTSLYNNGQQPGSGSWGGSGGSGWGRGPAPTSSSVPGVSAGAPPISSSPINILLPHEIEARKRMAAQRADAERKEAERAAANAPKPGVGFRHTWNPQKQQEIVQSVQREDRPTRTFGHVRTSEQSQGKPLSDSPLRKSGHLNPPVFDGADRRARPAYMDTPQSLSGRGYSTPPVYTAPGSRDARPSFNNRAQPPFRDDRRPLRSIPNQMIGGGLFTPPKPLIQKTTAPTEPAKAMPSSPTPVTSPPGQLGDNAIHVPHLTRMLGSEGFFDKPNQPDATRRVSRADDSHSVKSKLAQTEDWGTGLYSKMRTSNATQESQPPPTNLSPNNVLRSTWDSVSQHEGPAQTQNRPSTSDGSWNSLARRQQPKNGSSEDFLAIMEKSIIQPEKLGTGSRNAPLADWGKEFDKPESSQQRQPRRYDDNKYQPRQYDDNRSQPRQYRNERGPLDFGNTTETKGGTAETSFKEPETPSTPTLSPEALEYQERRSKRQEIDRYERQGPDRSDRSEIDRGAGRKSVKKRSGGRNTRYEDDADDGMDDSYENYMDRRQRKAERKAKRDAERTEPQAISLPELISITNLASALKVEKTVFLDQLAELGFEGVSLDSIMAGETAALVAQEYGYEPTVENGEDQDLRARPPPEDVTVLPPRPPVVTIMGHVDHGKTTLLDFLRKSSVAAGEHGGITQHIGAFSVSMSTGKQITFLDTPGHAAFLTMRQRGANVTDIVVLVVAADDSVKPQTLEAIRHARSSKVPIIVAINKVDKDGAQIDRVKADLASNGVEIEDFGGDVQVACVSGKTGQGMEDLEEAILTLAEILDMRAETDGPAEGWILESSLKPIGRAATILVKRGTLRPGDYIVAGTTYAKIRHLRNEGGQEIDEAPPGTPVEILGWRELPSAGDEVIQGPDERRVRQAAEYRDGLREREQDAAAHEKIAEKRRIHDEQRRAERAAEEGKHKRVDGSWGTQEQASDIENGTKMVNFVVKGDVHGSVEAVCAAIQEIGSQEVQPRVLLSSPGAITESDVEHAATSKSSIVNFNLPISGLIKRQADTAGVKILDHSVIYHLTDDVKDHLNSYLGVDISFKVLAEAEVLQIFPINIKKREYKNIAGCRIRNGTMERNHMFRVTRGGENIFEGKLESFKHGKKDIDEARKGGECGIGFEFFQDLQVGDQIQTIEEVRTKRTL